MNGSVNRTDGETGMSPWLRLLLIAICTLIFCSCRTVSQDTARVAGRPPLPSPDAKTAQLAANSVFNPVQQVAYSGGDVGSANSSTVGAAEASDRGSPLTVAAPSVPPPIQGPIYVDAQGNVLPRGTPPGVVTGAWTPPGIAGPWPQDEFLADGGDLPPFAGLAENGVTGINPEDTVARFQTADGKSRVQPFNRVFIYSPRFASVRQVAGLRANEQAEKVMGVSTPTHMARIEEVQSVGMGTQNYQARAGVQRRGLAIFQSGQRDGAVSQALGPRGFSDAFKPYENFSLIVKGQMVADEMPTLTQSVQAAVAWTADSQVQVVVDGRAASEEVGVSRVHSLYRVQSRYGESKLRLVKVASTATALPGETVDFTLRFDNVGTVPITDLLIIDNLSTRLEYVDGSSQASKAVEFSVQPNEAGSLTLQWRLTEPLPPGEGGIIRFQCRVR